MIYGFVPWDDVMDTVFGTEWPFPTFETFYFAESSVVFIIAAVDHRPDRQARRGADGQRDRRRRRRVPRRGADHRPRPRGDGGDEERRRSPTRSSTGPRTRSSGTTGAIFGPLAFLVNLPIAFLVPSSSGHAALIMPILAPLADFADAPRSIAVTAYQSASGLVNYITPTSAVVMGGLVLAKVRYDHYLRFALPFVGADRGGRLHLPRDRGGGRADDAQRRIRGRQAPPGHRPPARASSTPG